MISVLVVSQFSKSFLVMYLITAITCFSITLSRGLFFARLRRAAALPTWMRFGHDASACSLGHTTVGRVRFSQSSFATCTRERVLAQLVGSGLLSCAVVPAAGAWLLLLRMWRAGTGSSTAPASLVMSATTRTVILVYAVEAAATEWPMTGVLPRLLCPGAASCAITGKGLVLADSAMVASTRKVTQLEAAAAAAAQAAAAAAPQAAAMPGWPWYLRRQHHQCTELQLFARAGSNSGRANSETRADTLKVTDETAEGTARPCGFMCRLQHACAVDSRSHAHSGQLYFNVPVRRSFWGGA